MRSVLGYVAAQRSLGGGEKAFKDATKFLVGNMIRSLAKKLEIELLYGQMGYGTVASTSGSTVTVTLADWAPGIWSGAENMKIEIRDVTGATSRGTASITAVDLDTRVLTLSALPGGTVATDVIWHYGAYNNEFAGVHKIITNTSTLFNISAATYSLWKGNSYDAGSASLSLAKIEKAVAKAAAKGLDSDATVFVNVRTWADLLVEQAALRRYDGSYNSAVMENGGKSIKFHSQSGILTIEPSIYVKEGHAFILSLDDFVRVGSTEVSFKRPGSDGNYFLDLPDKHALELRAFTDQALFCSAPGKNVIITGIVNAT